MADGHCAPLQRETYRTREGNTSSNTQRRLMSTAVVCV